MKKTKLIATIMTICLAITTLAYGVYAATNLSFTIGANIAFEVDNLFVNITGNMTGAYNDVGTPLGTVSMTEYTSPTNIAEQPDDWAIGDIYFNPGAITPIVVTLTITNNTPGKSINCTLTPNIGTLSTYATPLERNVLTATAGPMNAENTTDTVTLTYGIQLNDLVTAIPDEIAISFGVVISEYIASTPQIYGVSRDLNATNNSVWTRTDDAVGKVANANQLESTPETFMPATDDFAMRIHGGTMQFFRDIDIVNIAVDDGEIKQRLSVAGTNFDWDGTYDGEAVNVMTYYPAHYIKRVQTATTETIQLSTSSFEGAQLVDAYYRGTFEACFDNDTTPNSLRSYARAYPGVGKNIAEFRTLARNSGMGKTNTSNQLGIGDWRDFDYQCIYLVKYADYNTEAKVGVGNNDDGSLNESGITHTTLNGRDGYIGSYKPTVWCLGLCNPWGNVNEFMDGMYVISNQAYVATDIADYIGSASEVPSVPTEGSAYTELGYTNSTSEGYVSKTGYDSNNSLFAFPIETTGTYETGLCDLYKCLTSETACVVIRGGNFCEYGMHYSGIFYLDCECTFDIADSYYSCRLLMI